MMRGMIGALSRTIGLKGADTDGSKRDENTDGNAHPLKRSRFSVPNFLQPFANEVDYRLDIPPSDDHEKAFHGRRDVLFAKPSLSKQRIANAFRVAKHYYEQEDSDALLTPSEEARTRTKQAATRFFENAYQVLKGTDQNFPLYQGNKCIGFVAIPNSKLVVIAVSQDRVPEKDATLRKDMIDLIARINEREKALHPGNEKIYQLALIPTKEEYLIFRALSAPRSYDGTVADELLHHPEILHAYDRHACIGGDPNWQEEVKKTLRNSTNVNFASTTLPAKSIFTTSVDGFLQKGYAKGLIEYRTRCVEAALMAALNKIGRTKKLDPKEISMEAFSGGLWEHPITEADIQGGASKHDENKPLEYPRLDSPQLKIGIDKFAAEKRNPKYTVEPSLEVPLEGDKKAYLDYWGPCSVHCKPLLENMRAFSVAGGMGSSFAGPIFEPEIEGVEKFRSPKKKAPTK